MPDELKVEYVDIDQLKPFIDNPREHSDRNINDILRSMKRFGWTNPVLVRREDNMVIAGHGRLEAARRNGKERIPVIYLDMSENDAKLYNVTDNRASDTSEWDMTALTDLMRELRDLPGVDIEDTGFELDELDDMLLDAEADGVVDPFGEWQGMPEFEQEDNFGVRNIIVHFETEEDVELFARLVEQKITDKTKYIWFPKRERAEPNSAFAVAE